MGLIFCGIIMTDQEKVEKMFSIRKQERPDLKQAAARISKCLFPESVHFQSLLDMYNERYPDD